MSLDAMHGAYENAKAAHKGSTVNCPFCKKPFVKRRAPQAFCGSTCKIDYWNAVRSKVNADPTRDLLDAAHRVSSASKADGIHSSTAAEVSALLRAVADDLDKRYAPGSVR